MTVNIIPPDKYTYDASAKTITLLDEYATVTAEQIKSIRNLTTKKLLFDSEQLYKNSITVTAGVIAGIPGDSAAQNTDVLQISYISLYIQVQSIDGGTP